jgi:heat shock protein HslJ
MSDTSPLVGRTFRVVEIGGEPTLDVPTAELTFGDDGRLTGRATINRVFGPYDMRGDMVSFGPLGSTMMAGLPAAMEQEQQVLRSLQGDVAVELGADGRVTLRPDAASALVLVEIDTDESELE